MKTRRYPYDINLQSLFGFADKQEGDIGLELEVEGVGIPLEGIGSPWQVVEDHSLRAPPGGAAREYRYRKSVPREGVPKSLVTLSTAFGKAKVNWSYRTSVHVHLNARQMSVRELYNMFTSYITLENVLSEYAGGLGRCGNLFCLRASDAENIVDNLVNALKEDDLGGYFHDNNLHYAGMNVNALLGKGSIEFRAMKGNLDTPFIQSWINTLLNLRDASKNYRDPRAVIEDLSARGVDGFIENLLPLDVMKSIKGQPGYRTSIMDGMRLAQEVAYAVEWPEKKEEKVPIEDKALKPKKRQNLFDEFADLQEQNEPRDDLDVWRQQVAAAVAERPPARPLGGAVQFQNIRPRVRLPVDFGNVLRNPEAEQAQDGDLGVIAGRNVIRQNGNWQWRN